MDVKFKEAIKNLPENIIKILYDSPKDVKFNAIEIRLRAGRQILINCLDDIYEINKKLSSNDLNECFRALCEYSIHSHTEEIKRGFITLKGGHRAGICGTAIYENDKIVNIKEISSINIRIAKQIDGISKNIIDTLNGDIGKLLIVGPPASGKTTILKDIAKNLNNKSVSIVDSRGEIAAALNGEPQNDVSYSDIFNFWNRYDGINAAIRTMNPDFIICDEIGDESDIKAIKTCVSSGVNLIATAHGSDFNELKKREIIKQILNTNAFSNIAILEGKKNPGKVKCIHKVGDLV